MLLDWCNAAIGPPIIDLERLLSEGVAVESRLALLLAYVDELRTRGIDMDRGDVDAALRLALPCLVQSAVGWAGREGLPSHGRAALVCEHWLRSAIGWGAVDDGRG